MLIPDDSAMKRNYSIDIYWNFGYLVETVIFQEFMLGTSVKKDIGTGIHDSLEKCIMDIRFINNLITKEIFVENWKPAM